MFSARQNVSQQTNKAGTQRTGIHAKERREKWRDTVVSSWGRKLSFSPSLMKHENSKYRHPGSSHLLFPGFVKHNKWHDRDWVNSNHSSNSGLDRASNGCSPSENNRHHGGSGNSSKVYRSNPVPTVLNRLYQLSRPQLLGGNTKGLLNHLENGNPPLLIQTERRSDEYSRKIGVTPYKWRHDIVRGSKRLGAVTTESVRKRSKLLEEAAKDVTPLRSQSDLNSSLHGINRVRQEVSYWFTRHNDGRPPWFPAGRGGNSKSHHRHLQPTFSRLRISNLPSKTVGCQSLDPPQSPQGSSRCALNPGRLRSLLAMASASVRVFPGSSLSVIPTVTRGGNMNHRRVNNYIVSASARNAQNSEVSNPSMILPKQVYTSHNEARKGKFASSVSRLSIPAVNEAPYAKKTEVHDNGTGKRGPCKLGNRSGAGNKMPQAFPVKRSNSDVAGLRTNVKSSLSDCYTNSKYIPQQQKAINKFRPPEQPSTADHIRSKQSPSSLELQQSALTAGQTKKEPSYSQVELFNPYQERFAGHNNSVLSTSHAFSNDAITYASLWDKVANGHTRSDDDSIDCLGSLAYGVHSVRELANYDVVNLKEGELRKPQQRVNNTSQETLIYVTDLSELSETQHSSLASKLNSIVGAEEMSVNLSWRTHTELEACEVSKASTWSFVMEKDISHIDSPQRVATLKGESPFFLLSDGDCDLSTRLNGDSPARHIIPELANRSRRTPSTRPVQTYVVRDTAEQKAVDLEKRQINEDSVDVCSVHKDKNQPHSRGRTNFFQKLGRSVRSFSNIRKKASMSS
ncbi:hypothetical protein T265_05180 [Opisthorchis viverrini]|uniref:Uncharacterized protein n=1 Tax=Opisthorchis viverrini TaxID=6198 RepID=A0A074ZLD4_OPIVI|nr:hypothetical protein T265_05180 [Opisthorchis viverrini]KER27901.1 hypothetical protein T265_05180 [Opisthorchis viverrini]